MPRRPFRCAITAPVIVRLALIVTVLLIAQLNPATALAQGTWTASDPVPIPRWWSAIGGPAGGRGRDVIAVAGGFSPSLGNLTDVEEFPCGTDTGWCAKPSMPGPQTAPAYTGNLIVAGGNNGSGPVATLSMSSIPFPWSTGPSMPTARQAPAGAFAGSLFYVMGGNTGSAVTGVVEAYSSSSNSWTSAASMLTPRSDLGADTINGIIYAAGGTDGSSPALDTLEAYDPTTDTWTTKASMPTARADLAVVAFNGLLYAIGGRGADGSPLATVEAYNPVTDTWTTEPSMPTARWGLVAVVADLTEQATGCVTCPQVPAIYAIGGALDAAGTTATGANEYFAPSCGTVSAEPASLSFRHKRRQTVTVTNTGSSNVAIFSALTGGPPFGISSDTCSGNTLAPSATCTITVKSKKLVKGSLTGALTVNDNACDQPQMVTLSGAK